MIIVVNIKDLSSRDMKTFSSFINQLRLFKSLQASQVMTVSVKHIIFPQCILVQSDAVRNKETESGQTQNKQTVFDTENRRKATISDPLIDNPNRKNHRMKTFS